MARKRRGRVVGFGILVTLGWLATVEIAGAREFGPQGVVREFCQADGLGQRVNATAWSQFPLLVAWLLEPAWDHVAIITGYQVDSPRQGSGGALAVDVHYSVAGHVSAFGFDGTAYIETVTFTVSAPDAVGWRIIGPPPPPHIFGNRVDSDALQRSLQQGGGPNFLSNSVFVWRMLRGAGWNVPYERTADLLNGLTYRTVERPAAGDLVVFLREDAPYHVGLLEAENQIVSSTLNGGIVRSSVDAFAGEVKYLRLLEPLPLDEVFKPLADSTLAGPTPAKPRPRPTRTPVPAAKRRGARRPAKARRAAQPSAHARVEHSGSSKVEHQESTTTRGRVE